MQDFIKKYSTDSIIISVILIILALFLIFKPGLSINIVMITLGIILVCFGIYKIINYFSKNHGVDYFNFQFTVGMLSLLCGLVFIFNPTLISSILPIAIGIWVIIESVTYLQIGLNLRAPGSSTWIITVLLSVVTFLLGLIILLKPNTAIEAAVSFSGVLLLISQIISIFETAYIMKTSK